jgi:hypothetical protein
MKRISRNSLVGGFGLLLGIAAATWLLNAQRQPEVERRTRLRLMPRTSMAGSGK